MKKLKSGALDVVQKRSTPNSNGIDNFDCRYSNINLNENYKCSNISSLVQSDSKSKKHDQTFVSTDNFEKGENLQSKIVEHCSKNLVPASKYDEAKEKVKNRWKKESSNATSSTLSLHIAAYENSVESFTNALDKNEGFKKKGLVEKWKNVKQIFTESLQSVIQNPFEFPRQQKHGQVDDPEVTQFKASQRLLNPNQSTSSTSFPQSSPANMDELINPSPTSSSYEADIADNKEDFSIFLKKKKKPQKGPEEPAKPKEDEKEIKKKELELKPKKCVDGFEYAEMIEAESSVAEYEKLKPNLARTYEFELDAFQQQAIVAMENGHSVFVAAHTSAGKTVVAEYAIALSRKHRSRVVYTSPIKALSNQKFRDFRNQFQDVGLITGDMQINEDASCLIMTTEILKSMLYNGRVSPDELEWVIFDEVHYINDNDRGHVWEEVLIMLPHQVKIVMLSATVPNCLEFADWVGRIKNRKIHVVQTLSRPVPLRHHLYFGINKDSRNCCYEIMGPNGEFNIQNFHEAKKAQAALWTQPDGQVLDSSIGHERGHYLTIVHFLLKQNLLPAVVFIFSRKKCNKFANYLCQSIDLTTTQEKAGIRELFEKYLATFKGTDRDLPQVKMIEKLCERGFAVHHSGILPVLKELVEILFQKGYVKFLLATETFAMGVNMPARSVIFDALDKFDGSKRRQLNCTEYIQMAGRAGRRGIDDSGFVAILSKGCDTYDYAALLSILLGKAISLESKFRITYNMLLNIIRAEQLNINDMLQSSYVERVSLRALSSKNEEIAKTLEKVNALPKLTCVDCTEVEESASINNYYATLMSYINKRQSLLTTFIKSNSAVEELMIPGRYLLICYPQKNIACMLVCIHTFINTKDVKELDVIALQTPQGHARKVGYDILSEEDKLKEKQNLFFEHSIKYGFETLVDNRQSCDMLEIIKNVPFENVIAICNAKVENMDGKEVSEYLQQRNAFGSRGSAPNRFVSNLMIEMDIFMKSNIQNPSNDFLLKFGEDLTSNEVNIRDEIPQLVLLRENLLDESRYICRQCVEFDSHIHMVHERQLLEAEHIKLKLQTSFAALTLTDDYVSCLQVLEELNFINKENLLTLKGKVAVQINEDTLLLTELIFENVFQKRNCSEIAAMLSAVTAQHRFSKHKNEERNGKIKTKFTDADIINSLKDEISTIANKLDIIEGKYNVVNARTNDVTFGLMEAVYQWAEGMSFEQITHLTDADEGKIVRCIQRLDDILTDIKNAGEIIGDKTLVEKMTETSAAICRDIVFHQSLYVANN